MNGTCQQTQWDSKKTPKDISFQYNIILNMCLDINMLQYKERFLV